MDVNISESCKICSKPICHQLSPSLQVSRYGKEHFLCKNSRTLGSSLSQLARRGVWYGPCSLLGTDGPDPLSITSVSGMQGVIGESCQARCSQEIPKCYTTDWYGHCASIGQLGQSSCGKARGMLKIKNIILKSQAGTSRHLARNTRGDFRDQEHQEGTSGVLRNIESRHLP